MKKRRRCSSRARIISPTHFLFIVLIAGSLAWIAYAKACSKDVPARTSVTLNGSLLDVKMPASIPSQPVSYRGMDISFNPELHIPNWVAWELTGEEVEGTVPRYNKFMSDNRVKGCPQTGDYSYSGYDRGHMAPAGDMKWDSEAMRETFYLTNICPQAKTLNTGAWKRLEEKCRLWAQADSAIVIVSGPVPSDAPLEYLGNSRVAVPARFFKVIVSPYANPPRGIGFIMPNSRVEGGMQRAAVSIDEVEAITGYDFFSALPDSIESVVESQCDFNRWSRIKP